MKRLIAALALSAATVPAMAWGEREQGALAGIVGTLIFQHIQRDNTTTVPQTPQQPPQVIIQQGPPIVIHQPLPPRPIQCWYVPVYDAWGYYRGDRRICH